MNPRSPGPTSGSRSSAIAAAAFLSLTLGMFLFYDAPFAPRSAGPLVIAAAPLAR